MLTLRKVVLNCIFSSENGEVKGSPWSSIAEKVMPDLLSSFEIMRTETENEDSMDVKPTIVARFGKILFNG